LQNLRVLCDEKIYLPYNLIMSEQFKPVSWSHNTNIYEVNVRQYTKEGTFKAFEKELPRLKDMGIEVLWFMPITPISREKRLGVLGSYYACSDYTSINPEFGNLEDFKTLVKSAHQLQMKVIIDWVGNHTGWDHTWTREHPEFYRKNLEGNFYDPHGWEDVIDLNYDNPDLVRAMIAAMEFWLRECNIDGFRCDMAMLVPLEFWRKARTHLDSIKKLFWLAECEEINYHEVFDTTYAWKLLHKMEAYWKKETDLKGFLEVLSFYKEMFPATAFRALFTTNHDENSHSGSEYERMGDAAKAFAVLSCTWPGIPLIYSGQELPNYKRLRFFEKDEIEWNGKYLLHDFYKKLLLLRKSNAAMRAGDVSAKMTELKTDADNFVLAYLREYGNNEVLVLLNLSGEDKPLIKVKDEILKGCFTNIFSGIERDFANERYFSLRPWEYQVYSKT
jgi:glycosidase